MTVIANAEELEKAVEAINEINRRWPSLGYIEVSERTYPKNDTEWWFPRFCHKCVTPERTREFGHVQMEYHHIIPQSTGVSLLVDDQNNIVPMCWVCHAQWHRHAKQLGIDPIIDYGMWHVEFDRFLDSHTDELVTGVMERVLNDEESIKAIIELQNNSDGFNAREAIQKLLEHERNYRKNLLITGGLW